MRHLQRKNIRIVENNLNVWALGCERIIRPALHDAWLSADTKQAAELMSWRHIPELEAYAAPR